MANTDCPVVVVPRPGRKLEAAPQTEPGPRMVVGLKVDGPDDATLDFAFTEAALRDARLQVVAAYPWPVQAWAAPDDMVQPVIAQDAVESETRTLAEGLLAPCRERHPDVRVEPFPAPGDAAGHLVAASKDADLVVVGAAASSPPPASWAPSPTPYCSTRQARWRSCRRRRGRSEGW